MYYTVYRYEKFFATFLTAIILYSMTLSVIAQDRFKEANVPTYKVKLALANLPRELDMINKRETKTDQNISDTYNYTQASLKISPSENKNLLVSYLGESQNLFTENKKTNLFALISPIEEPSIRPLAVLAAPLMSSQADEKKWDQAVKQTYKNGLIKSVAPGVKHITIRRYTKAGPMFINVVEVNPSINNNISILPALAGTTLPHTSKVSIMARQNNAIAGINASYFKTTTGVPLGSLIINEELVTGPIYDRVALGIGDKEFNMARISLQGKLTTSDGKEIIINNVNQPRMLSSYTLIYSEKWGKIAPPSPKYGIQLAIQDGKVIDKSTQRLNIPTSGYVVVGPEKQLGSLNIGDSVQIKFSTTPDWSGIKHAVSGGPYLVKEGEIYIDTKDQKLGSVSGRNPRTAVGYTKDNRFIMITIDGRQRGSVGATFNELARIMKEYGCYNAMNLDGGSSTQMFVNNRVVNNPLNKGGSYVSNALIVKLNDE